jgi:Ca2+-binding EF-hand superfamily protein
MINPKEFKEGQLLRIITKLQQLKDNNGIMKNQIETSFKKFDKDKNGVLDRLELKQFLIIFFDKYKMHVPINEEFIDETFRDIDKNNDGKI